MTAAKLSYRIGCRIGTIMGDVCGYAVFYGTKPIPPLHRRLRSWALRQPIGRKS